VRAGGCNRNHVVVVDRILEFYLLLQIKRPTKGGLVIRVKTEAFFLLPVEAL